MSSTGAPRECRRNEPLDQFQDRRAGPETADCAWKAATGYFQCPVKVPSGIKTGESSAYAITAQERLGTAFVPIPATGMTVNQETIHSGNATQNDDVDTLPRL
jgi:hypothetical protein